MSYNTDLQSNNVDLQSILNTINALPEASSEEQATPVISINTSGLITATAGTKSATKQLAFQPAKTITPSAVSQIAVSSGYYTGGNITVASVPTQSKSITPTSTIQNITPDSGKFLSKVTINPIPNNYIVPSGTLTITSNGTHDVKNYASATVEIAGGSGEAAEWSANEDEIITKGISGVYMNDRVNTIASSVFAHCSKLTSVSFSVCTSIRGDAFYSCYNLTTANFPACINIGSAAFKNCSNLTTVSFPVCTTIGSYAFQYCSRLTTVSFPVCTSISYYAFNDCSSLVSISFPVCTSISGAAFYRCSNLTTANFPACTTISSSAFNACNKLTSLNFPNCTTIGSNAFIYCRSLTSVSFPVCTAIGNYAFEDCNNLASVNLPVCTSIGGSAFYDCYRLSALTLGTSSVCTLSNSNVFAGTPYAGYSAYFSGTPYIYVPASLVSTYQGATNWTYFSSYISAISETENSGGGDTGSGGLITFTIGSTEYQAEDGMTWEEWCASEYNNNYEVRNNNVCISASQAYVLNPDGITSVLPSEEIIANSYYNIMNPGAYD